MEQREIKFRAWDKKRKIMVNGFSRCYLSTTEYQAGYSIGDIDDFGGILILMQYTGLKDKNGKEIYEGDILTWNGGIGDGHEYEVVWCQNYTGFYLIMTERESKGYRSEVNLSKKYCLECEIIGNIYENSNLLK